MNFIVNYSGLFWLLFSSACVCDQTLSIYQIICFVLSFCNHSMFVIICLFEMATACVHARGCVFVIDKLWIDACVMAFAM